MRKCLKCGASISHLHKNSKYCNRHKPFKPKPKPMEHLATIDPWELQKLKRDSDILKQIKELLL